MQKGRIIAALEACYDAVADPEGWAGALQGVADAADATCAMFLPKNPTTFALKSSHSYNEFLEAYVNEGWSAGHYRAERGWPILERQPVILEHELASDDERKLLRHYNELYLRWGFPWFAAVGFNVAGTEWCMPFLRTEKQGFFTPDDAKILASLSSHLNRIHRLSELFGTVQQSYGIEILERVGKAALLLDHDGRVLIGNTHSRDILRKSSSSIGIRSGRLFACHPESNRQLNNLLAANQRETNRCCLGPIVINREIMKPLIVEGVNSRNLLSLFTPKAGIILLITDMEERKRPSQELLRVIYGLTPAEVALAIIFADGLTIEECADLLCITVGSARQRLKSLMSKTETHRQADLAIVLEKISRQSR